jgi:hypothetical protein
MISESEYPMIVDELRDDSGFVDALERLRFAISIAARATHPDARRRQYAEVANRLHDVYARLGAKR